MLLERLEVSEGSYTVDLLAGAGEAFLASTTREVQPISAIDDRTLATGPRTAEAQEAFASELAAALGASAR